MILRRYIVQASLGIFIWVLDQGYEISLVWRPLARNTNNWNNVFRSSAYFHRKINDDFHFQMKETSGDKELPVYNRNKPIIIANGGCVLMNVQVKLSLV